MFSKALFKQSIKANKTMWYVVTFAVCFMLACVMLISGNGNIGNVKNEIQDTIIIEELNSQMQKRGLSYYSYINDGLEEFDVLFSKNEKDVLTYLMWFKNIPNESDESYNEYLKNMPIMETQLGNNYLLEVSDWQKNMPQQKDYLSSEEYLKALEIWENNSPISLEYTTNLVYTSSINELKQYVILKANEMGYMEDSKEFEEMFGCIIYAINPNNMFDDFYNLNNEIVDDYDITYLINNVLTKSIDEIVYSSTRIDYRLKRANNHASIFLAGNMINKDNVSLLLEELKSYGITEEKYNNFGYTYDYIKNLSNKAIITYQAQIEYEIDLINQKYNGNVLDEEYINEVNNKKNELANEISSSFLQTLPKTVSDALEEIGKADLYTLIVGSIFYKLAGLLLPIIFMIMVSNNLIVGQVDSGQMAYILSTSTKRKTIVFTQSMYLIISLLAMFICTTITSVVCLSIVPENVDLTYSNLILLNLGAFLVLFALSGLCFFTSCYFDRSKYQMAIGGGLSIFALVAAMLGLFGSPAIPAVIRLNSLNYFNYVTIISLFDVIKIIEGNNIFILKLIILLILGIIGYVLGSIKFDKKDLPL